MLPITPEAYKLGMPVRCILSSLHGSRDLVSDSRNTFTRYFKAIYVIKLLPYILVFKELYKNLSTGSGSRTRVRLPIPPYLYITYLTFHEDSFAKTMFSY